MGMMNGPGTLARWAASHMSEMRRCGHRHGNLHDKCCHQHAPTFFEEGDIVLRTHKAAFSTSVSRVRRIAYKPGQISSIFLSSSTILAVRELYCLKAMVENKC